MCLCYRSVQISELQQKLMDANQGELESGKVCVRVREVQCRWVERKLGSDRGKWEMV